jgi:tRNA 2-selenouridine synthase
MIKSVKYSEIDNKQVDNCILIDVRSPGEFKEATIPGAVNIPLYSDEDRKVIGTVYTQESVEKAKKLGVEAASKHLPIIYEEISELEKKFDTLILFCARGGMRSSSLVSLFTPLGINAYKLIGGYKGYRAYVNEELPKLIIDVKFVVIHGNTGVGKTSILKVLKDMGKDVLDLEECANHRGSLLGSVGLGLPNSQKQFESLVFESLKARKSDLVFVEGESKRIGRVIIPEFLFQTMEAGKHIMVEADIDLRVKNILDEYVGKNNDEIIDALNLLRKHINSKKIDEYIEMIKSDNFEEVIRSLMIKYYDPMYENKQYDFAGVIQNNNIIKTSEEIIKCSRS